MATSTIMNPNSPAITQNLKSITRVVASGTTGGSGNLILPEENDGTTFVVGAHAYGTNAFLRTWVSGTNNHWFFTAVDPNTGATINNANINYRYLVVKLYSS